MWYPYNQNSNVQVKECIFSEFNYTEMIDCDTVWCLVFFLLCLSHFLTHSLPVKKSVHDFDFTMQIPKVV